MRKNLVRLMLGILSIAGLIVAGCGGDKQPPKDVKEQPSGSSRSSPYADTVLRLGRIPFSNATGLVQKHEKFLEYLTEELGVKGTRLVLAPTYQGILDRLKKGEIDIAWLGTASSVEAREDEGIFFLAKPKRFGTTSYRGIILTRGNSGIRSLKDLKGKRFAWVEPESASGYIFPKALLIQAGIDPDKDFSEASFVQKHDAVVLNVLLEKYDAGACYDDARTTLRDKAQSDELTILATTQDISNEPIVCRSSLPKDLIDHLQKALFALSVKNPAHKSFLEAMEIDGFMPADKKDYDYMAKMLKLLDSKPSPGN